MTSQNAGDIILITGIDFGCVQSHIKTQGRKFRVLNKLYNNDHHVCYSWQTNWIICLQQRQNPERKRLFNLEVGGSRFFRNVRKFTTGLYVATSKKKEILSFLIFIAVTSYVIALRIKRLASNDVMNMDHFCTIKEITIPRQLDQGRSEMAEKR
jgi:hypothetical protein